MENEQDKQGYLVVGAIVAIVIAYFVGASSVETAPVPVNDDSTITESPQYQDLMGCANGLEGLSNDAGDAKQTLDLVKGVDASYDDLSSAVYDAAWKLSPINAADCSMLN